MICIKKILEKSFLLMYNKCGLLWGKGELRPDVFNLIYNILHGRSGNMALFDTTAFRILEQGINVMWTKQQIIQENIANIDTPEYNCKYLTFSGILKDKIRADGSIKKELNLAHGVVVDTITSDQEDRNNVDQVTQMAEYARTAYQIDALINEMDGNFSRIRSALATK